MSDNNLAAWSEVFSEGLLAGRATHLSGLHPRSADYIRQAPVLVCVSLAFKPKQVWPVWTALCERGAKLGEVLDTFGINRGLRHLHPAALFVARERLWGEILVKANASAISQQLVARTPEQQNAFGQFLLSLHTGGVSGERVIWFAENVPPDFDMAIQHLIDFLRSSFGTPLHSGWRWREFIAATKHWEESFAKQKALEEARYNAPLCPHAYLPTRWERDGIVFEMLNTTNQLRAEGSHMRHCVGGYDGSVGSGESVIYACTNKGKRDGTLELRRARAYSYRVPMELPVSVSDAEADKQTETVKVETRYTFVFNQFKSYSNGPPSYEAQAAARVFEKEMFGMPNEREMEKERDAEAKELLGRMRIRAMQDAERAAYEQALRYDQGQEVRATQTTRNMWREALDRVTRSRRTAGDF